MQSFFISLSLSYYYLHGLPVSFLDKLANYQLEYLSDKLPVGVLDKLDQYWLRYLSVKQSVSIFENWLIGGWSI